MKPRLIVEQKITAFVNKYRIYQAAQGGVKADLLAFAQQKRLAFKEKVTFYSDEQKSAAAFGFRAEKILDVHGRYFVEDTNGTVVGMFKKQFRQSLLISTWVLSDKDGTDVFQVRESNETLAALRRFAGFIPYLGDLFEVILLFFRYHFVVTDVSTGEVVGRYQKTTLLRDHYLLSMTDEAYARLDWRVFAAISVGLDALQSR